MDELAAHKRLGDCAPYEVMVDARWRNLTVDRGFIAAQFGGNVRRMFSASPVPGIGSFLFPTLVMDPQLPLEPGLPGLLCRPNLAPEWKDGPLRVFVGLKSAHFFYVGDYVLEQTTPLSREEYGDWQMTVCFDLSLSQDILLTIGTDQREVGESYPREAEASGYPSAHYQAPRIR